MDFLGCLFGRGGEDGGQTERENGGSAHYTPDIAALQRVVASPPHHSISKSLYSTSLSSSCWSIHLTMCSWPCFDAFSLHSLLLPPQPSQGQGGFWALNHFKTSRCPASAAAVQVHSPQGQGGSCALRLGTFRRGFPRDSHHPVDFASSPVPTTSARLVTPRSPAGRRGCLSRRSRRGSARARVTYFFFCRQKQKNAAA